MEGEKREQDTDAADAKAVERPAVELHNPMNAFDFEPTAGNEF